MCRMAASQRKLQQFSLSFWSYSHLRYQLTKKQVCRHHGSLVSTSLPDVDSEIEKVSVHSLRGKAMRAMQDRLRKRHPMPSSRENRMAEDQDWTNVYPTAASFKWSAVPLSVRMGYPVNRGIPPHKLGNAELLKIPNFLHLTPLAIKKHCAALKGFCTKWPDGLNTDELCDEHFPVAIETSDYIFSSPSLRCPKARLVQVKLKLSKLPLDKHARWKLIQLVGDLYNKETDELCISADRCPVKQQNLDYAMYLLSVLFHEAHITEPWEETEQTEEDMEEYTWESGKREENLMRIKGRMHNKETSSAEEELKTAYTQVCNNKETSESIGSYKRAVLNLFGLKEPAPET